MLYRHVRCMEGRMKTFFNDLSYGFRQLRRSRGMAILAILTLALGVGANTAIFTVIESVLTAAAAVFGARPPGGY